LDVIRNEKTCILDPNYTNLKLNHSGLRERSRTLFNILSKNTSVTSLDVSYNMFDDKKDCGNIANILKSNKSIQHFNISSSKFYSGVKEFFDGILGNDTLTSLEFARFDLSSNTICQHVAEVIRAKRNIKTLYIADNAICSRGLEKITTAIKDNTTLTKLDICRSHMRNAEFSNLLGDMLMTNQSLRILVLRGNEFKSSDCSSITAALKVNNTLTEIDLAQNKLDLEGLGQFGEVLMTNKTLKTLLLSGYYFEVKEDNFANIITFCNGLKRNKSLEYLDLSYSKLGSAGYELLGAALAENQSIKTINLQGIIDNEGYIGNAFLKNKSVTNLSLSGVKMTDKFQLMAEAVKNNTSLQVLDLRSTNLDSSNVGLLAEALKINSSVTNLCLAGNSIGDHGASHISEMLKTNQSITKLFLNGIAIGTVGMQSLSDALKINCHLQTLYLGYNRDMMFDGIKALGEAIETNQSLTSLHLDNVKMDSKGCEYLARSLERNKSITELVLRSNELLESGFGALGNALKTNQTLIVLDMNFCRLESEGVAQFAEGLKNNISLTNIDLGLSKFTTAANMVLADVLLVNRALTKFEVQFDFNSKEIAKYLLCERLEMNKARKFAITSTLVSLQTMLLPKEPSAFSQLPNELIQSIVEYVVADQDMSNQQVLFIINFAKKRSNIIFDVNSRLAQSTFFKAFLKM
jgi:Ran GTPase-activating protein (RanGAP) involved in mRNA processing and transport